eukprot:363905-Chlamydomonas_euryale.AAC.2
MHSIKRHVRTAATPSGIASERLQLIDFHEKSLPRKPPLKPSLPTRLLLVLSVCQGQGRSKNGCTLLSRTCAKHCTDSPGRTQAGCKQAPRHGLAAPPLSLLRGPGKRHMREPQLGPGRGKNLKSAQHCSSDRVGSGVCILQEGRAAVRV